MNGGFFAALDVTPDASAEGAMRCGEIGPPGAAKRLLPFRLTAGTL